MTTLKQLQALVDAGDKATQGECFVYSEPEVGMPPEVQYINGEDRNTFAWCGEKDCDFIAQAANSRPAIKSAIAEIEAKDKALQIIAYGSLSHTDGLLGAIDYLRLTAKQALGACETTERSEDNDVR